MYGLWNVKIAASVIEQSLRYRGEAARKVTRADRIWSIDAHPYMMAQRQSLTLGRRRDAWMKEGRERERAQFIIIIILERILFCFLLFKNLYG